ncbi:hypothetical protein N0V82_005443 [Gnomoniopsis sp. IMI 355080]|nr:hypothetical protein N0V82_005443 [Gnomoniopsis sp. IMI 355080]
MSRRHEAPVWSRSPLRQLYQAFRLASFLCHLPLWIAFSAIPYTRLQRTWSFKQSLMLYIAHFFVDTQARIGITDQLTLEPQRDGDRFQMVEPFDEKFYQGPLVAANIRPTNIGGVWFPQRLSTTPKGPVVLLIHGGAMVTGDGRSGDYGALANNLLNLACVDAVFSVQYRLSGYGKVNPFPAALQDVLTAYIYLRKSCEIPARSIVIAGNSSGANLVVALVRYLEEVMPQLGLPLCAVGVSLWVVPLESLAPGYSASRRLNYSTEYVADSFHKWGAKTYQPPNGVTDDVLPYITLLGQPFKTVVPILVTWGEREILGSAIVAWAEEMQSVAGNKVEVYCDKDAVHASLFVGEKMGWGENARRVCVKIREFIQDHI